MKYSKDAGQNKFVDKIINKLKQFQFEERYLGCFIFGSVARGEYEEGSDIDVVMYVKGKSCDQINHPVIDGVKLDISFNDEKSLNMLLEFQFTQRRRIPMIAESIILFDKTGELASLKKKALSLNPKEIEQKDMAFNYYLIYNEDRKVKKYAKTQPDISQFIMHTSLFELLKTYYQINGRWFVGNKRILSDLNLWNPPLSLALKRLVLETDINKKLVYWDEVIILLMQPFGKVRSIEEKNCNCDICKRDLEKLTTQT